MLSLTKTVASSIHTKNFALLCRRSTKKSQIRTLARPKKVRFWPSFKEIAKEQILPIMLSRCAKSNQWSTVRCVSWLTFCRQHMSKVTKPHLRMIFSRGTQDNSAYFLAILILRWAIILRHSTSTCYRLHILALRKNRKKTKRCTRICFFRTQLNLLCLYSLPMRKSTLASAMLVKLTLKVASF